MCDSGSSSVSGMVGWGGGVGSNRGCRRRGKGGTGGGQPPSPRPPGRGPLPSGMFASPPPLFPPLSSFSSLLPSLLFFPSFPLFLLPPFPLPSVLLSAFLVILLPLSFTLLFIFIKIHSIDPGCLGFRFQLCHVLAV